MTPEKVKIESGVRKHLRRTTLQRIRQWWVCRSVGNLGQGIFIERNVRFQRYIQHLDIGSQVIIKEGSRICVAQPTANINIGDWTTVGHHTFIFASSQISIGANCLIAPFCYLVDANHGIRRDQLIRNQALSASAITIGDDVWLGCGVRVLRGTTIHDGAVIGAGSVVDQDIPAYSIARGIPARVIGERR